ncbi:transcriptional regulator [Roseibium aquae]|uniref:Transcriptional regulator n=1 Tax=Roseibium aquae TaxID=1323746 RepID=A0A916TLH0_9HYPH|nr:metalloregulator ArsR/SmtB family transcription factor [Roseibium aquae]GGB54685.1 transcriptional regulator [Roseibium aquae]
MADRTRSRLLNALKSSGPLTAAELARRLDVTPVATRQHLDGLLADRLVRFEDLKGSVGRPKRVWSLTGEGHGQFPDSHANLIVGVLGGLTALYGPGGLEAVIKHRERQMELAYRAALRECSDPRSKVERLALLRDQEGYMAEVESCDGGFLLIENHCSICAAATACRDFCRSEWRLFQAVMGEDVWVQREEHLLSGDRRCVYRITPV